MLSKHRQSYCEWCEEPFVKGNRQQRFCSITCGKRGRWGDALPVKPMEGLEELECAECGTVFAQRVKIQRFCSAECRTAHLEKGTFTIFERDGFACFWCGKSSFEDKAELHLEHVFPLVAGGTNRAENLVTSCADCNLEKAAQLISARVIERVIREIRRRNADRGILDNQRIKPRDGDRRDKKYARKARRVE
jgi:hypothetical protein